MVDAKVLKDIDQRIQETEDEIQELALDGLKIPKLTKEITQKFEKIEDLIALSLNECELESLDGFPSINGLIRLELTKNKFKANELGKVVEKFPKLQILMLTGNNISDYKEIQPLAGLKELIQLDLAETPLSKKGDYRKKVFELISSLEVLDELDKDGNPYDFDEDEEGDDDEEFDDNDDEDGDDDYDDDDDDEEEYKAKPASKNKKTKK